MPPQIAAAAGGRGNGFRGGSGPFKPPRPRPSAGVAASSSSARRSGGSGDVDDDDEDGGEDEAVGRPVANGRSGGRASRGTQPRDHQGNDDEEKAIGVASDGDESDDDRGKALPPALLARLLHHFFQNPGEQTTRLTQDAHAAVGKYMEIFVREAVARSAKQHGGGGFLDVDVLQKVAGQLIMDM